jgi:hypothetical protein
MMIAEFITSRDPRWTRYLRTAPHDFYHVPEYAELCAKHEKGVAAAFYAEDGGATFLAPVLIRAIPRTLDAPAGWYDCVSPYGYSTPVVTPCQESLERFLEAFCHAARERSIVTAFFRLHPLLPLNLQVLGKFGQLAKHGQTVYVDLSKSADDIWRQTRANHRRDIRKLDRLGFRVALDDWSLFEAFLRLYDMTMRRVGARPDYLFSREYFQELRATLGSHLHLCTVLSKEDEVASAGTYVDWDGIVQFHLAGNETKYLSLAPSKLMQHFMCGWAKETSNSVFHLGGGVGGVEDSLFEFKAGFSKQRADFFTYRIVLDEEKNALLSRAAEAQMKDARDVAPDFFPVYRKAL